MLSQKSNKVVSKSQFDEHLTENKGSFIQVRRMTKAPRGVCTGSRAGMESRHAIGLLVLCTTPRKLLG